MKETIESFLNASVSDKEKMVLKNISKNGSAAIDIPWRISGAIVNENEFQSFEKLRAEVSIIIGKLIDSEKIKIGKKLLLFCTQDVKKYAAIYEFNEFEQIVSCDIREVYDTDSYRYVEIYETRKQAAEYALTDVEYSLKESEEIYKMEIIKTLHCKANLLEIIKDEENKELKGDPL